MYRIAIEKLLKWKQSKRRKPLIIEGARQVGKTWLMKEFAERFFAQRNIYINFDEEPRWASVFEKTHDPEAILRDIRFTTGRQINDDWLLILDEVQGCPNAIHALKYFCENKPQLRVIAAGSLLGLALAQPESYPVGKVEFLSLEPMSFEEFLWASGEDGLVEALRQWCRIEPLTDILYARLLEAFQKFEVIGGMPEAVSAWVDGGDMTLARKIQKQILDTYLADIRTHSNSFDAPKIVRIWESLPRMLAREQKKFQYSIVEEKSNARKYRDSLQWLINARLVRPVHRIDGMGVPLSAYKDANAFKIYLVDVGLLCRLSGLDPALLREYDENFREHKGALAENLVLQSLVPQFENEPLYWSMNNPPHEVDFLIERKGKIIPIEVKSGTNLKSKSLSKFKELYKERIALRVRFSLANLSLDGDILNIPLFMADETDRLIGMALDEMANR